MGSSSSQLLKERPAVALAIVGSNTTAIAAELVAEVTDYPKFLAIRRRDTNTSLPVAMDGELWAKQLKRLGWFGASKTIKAFWQEIETLVGGQYFDCMIHHSKDPFSQLLSGHPLCRNYFYIEEGFSAILGGTFGRPKKKRLRRLLWSLKSKVFYGGLINRYREFFDTRAPNYGGVYAISSCAFKDFPGRVQLHPRETALPSPLPAKLVIFLDSQYFIGNCSEENYAKALEACLASILTESTSAAIKFHPGERDPERKSRFIKAVESSPYVSSLIELPQTYVGERMAFDATAKVVVGTSALGLYLADRGFQTFTFAPRIIPTSKRYEMLMREIPAEFQKLCRSA